MEARTGRVEHKAVIYRAQALAQHCGDVGWLPLRDGGGMH
jgi:hypothetical protein